MLLLIPDRVVYDANNEAKAKVAYIKKPAY